MTSILSSIFFFIVALGTLITFHEFGHYWVARRVGVKVQRFSIGFGRALLSWKRGPDNTEYVLAAVPLGGYVKMLDEREGPVEPHEQGRAFNRQRLRDRFAIVVAGPLFNFIFAILAYWLVFMLGITSLKPIVAEVVPQSMAAAGGFQAGDELQRVAGKDIATWEGLVFVILDKGLQGEHLEVQVKDKQGNQAQRSLALAGIADKLEQGNLLQHIGIQPVRPEIPAVIGQIESDSPAELAGLQQGDRIVSAAGVVVSDWDDLVKQIQAHPERDLALELERNGGRQNIVVRPAATQRDGQEVGRIGAGPQQPDVPESLLATQKFNLFEAFPAALEKTWDMSLLTLRMLGKMLVGEVSMKNLSGPVSIAQYAGYSASIGLVAFLSFLALISISLGVLNLLPIPVLDGGHLFYFAIEGLRGKPLSDEIQMVGQQVGMTMIFGLMIFALYNDFVRLFQ